MKAMLHSFCAIFLSLFLITGALAQSSKSRKLFTEAEKAYREKSYQTAIQICRGIISEESNYYGAEYLLGKSYYMTYNFVAAKDHFSVLEKRQDFGNSEVRYMLGMTYKALGEYDAAKPMFEKFILNTSDNNMKLKAEVELEGVKMALENGDLKADFQFKNGGDQLKSAFAEVAISLVPGDKRIVVTRLTNDPKKLAENIKYADAQIWMKIDDGDEFDFLNTSTYEGAGTFDAELENYYFTKCDNAGNNCQFVWSRNVDGIWQQAASMPKGAFPPEFNYKDPFLSGDTLFFSSDKRGGIGGMDIWYSVRNNQGFWTIPVNLGEPVNTPFDEVSPFVNSKGTFYFSSNGHAGYGLFDVFYVNGLNGNRTIHNIGAPFNSSVDDIHFKIADGQGYLVSNRPGGRGDYDIYLFEEVVKKEIAVEAVNEELNEQVYAVLFNSRLYQVNPKFIGKEYDGYVNMDVSERQELNNQVTDSYNMLADEEITKIVNDDKILRASLSKDDKFFIDRLAAAYFENEKSLTLNISEEDINYYNSLENAEKRKLYRLSLVVINDLKGDFDPLARGQIEQPVPAATFKTASLENEVEEEISTRESASQETVLIQDGVEPEEEVKAVNVEPEEGESYMKKNEQVAVRRDQGTEAGHKAIDPEPAEEETKRFLSTNEKRNDETFTSLLGVNTSLSFYQNLSFVDKKRVDRIMAIRLVNEKYTLAPGLSDSDRQYFYTLSQNEKDAIERLKLYFRSWNKNKELANLKDHDLNYLSSLPPAKREQIARIIVRRGIGVDDENFIRFNSSDWNRYKSFSHEEVVMIKHIADMLKEHQQMFDVALAYAGTGYTFNNNLAYALSDPVPVSTKAVASDPEQQISGTKFTYESIYFDAGEHALRKEAMEALNELVDIYQQNPEISVALDAYSYERGNEPENIQLSTLRGSTAKSYLVNQGIPDYKIKNHAFSTSINISHNNSLRSLKNRKLDLSIVNTSNVFQSDFTTYLVQPGNTLFSLSKANGMTVDELMALNGLDNTMLYAYQPLRVKKTATLNTEYMMDPSDDLIYDPIQQHAKEEQKTDDYQRPSAQQEEEAEKPGDIRGEDMMVIDVTESKSKAQRIHIVQKGEKLEDIARKYDTSVKAIMDNNDLKKQKVKKGQKLKIIQ